MKVAMMFSNVLQKTGAFTLGKNTFLQKVQNLQYCSNLKHFEKESVNNFFDK